MFRTQVIVLFAVGTSSLFRTVVITAGHELQLLQRGQSLQEVARGVAKRERWGAGVETQKNVRGEMGGWGRVPFNEPYAPSLSTIYDGA